MESVWLINEFQRTMPDIRDCGPGSPVLTSGRLCRRTRFPAFWGRSWVRPSKVSLSTSLTTYVQELTASSLRAIAKIEADGSHAKLTDSELRGTEAIIAVWGRPAILIQDGRFFQPPDPWRKLEDHRPAIEDTIARVGRVQLSGHPRYDWVGTAFLVAELVVMTARHVVKEFGIPTGSQWLIESPIKVSIDFNVELGSTLKGNTR